MGCSLVHIHPKKLVCSNRYRYEASRASWIWYSCYWRHKQICRGKNPLIMWLKNQLHRNLQINAVVVDFFYGPAAFFAKLSIFLLYLRTFAPNQWMRRLTHCGIAINLIFYAGIALAFGISCIGPSQDSINSRCRQVTKPLKYIVSIFGAISNLYIYILPLPVIWHLQMTFRRKVGVSVIFAIGILCVHSSSLFVLR